PHRPKAAARAPDRRRAARGPEPSPLPASVNARGAPGPLAGPALPFRPSTYAGARRDHPDRRDHRARRGPGGVRVEHAPPRRPWMLDYRSLKAADPEIYQAIADERARQNFGLELIASENFVSQAVMEATGSVLTNKYAEGYPGKRYYGGCEFVDVVERLAIDRAKALFGAAHVNVQPHKGTPPHMPVHFPGPPPR